MGNMKTFLIIAYERWGGLRPECAWDKKGRCFVPVILGIWIRCPFYDYEYKNLS